MKALFVALVGPTLLLASCNDTLDDADDQVEDAAEVRATAAGPAAVAFGLSEAQLLEADVIDAGDSELGDVEGVLRGADGQIDRLLVEIEDSNPDRFVALPIAGLRPVPRGDDTDLRGDITRAQLTALPDATLTSR